MLAAVIALSPAFEAVTRKKQTDSFLGRFLWLWHLAHPQSCDTHAPTHAHEHTRNVYIAGGTSLIPNVRERLERELVHAGQKIKVCVYCVCVCVYVTSLCV